MSIITLELRSSVEANFVKRWLKENQIAFQETEKEADLLQEAIHEVKEIRKGNMKGLSVEEFWEAVHAD
jgi:glutaredoxin